MKSTLKGLKHSSSVLKPAVPHISADLFRYAHSSKEKYRAAEIKSIRVQNYAAAVLDAAAADSSERRRCSAIAVATPVSDWPSTAIVANP